MYFLLLVALVFLIFIHVKIGFKTICFTGREDPRWWFCFGVWRKLCAAHNSWNFSNCWCCKRRIIWPRSLCNEISGSPVEKEFILGTVDLKEVYFLTFEYLFGQTLKEAIDINNSVPQGLSSSIFTSKPETIFKWIGWVVLNSHVLISFLLSKRTTDESFSNIDLWINMFLLVSTLGFQILSI